MPRKPRGPYPLTNAERQALHRMHKASEHATARRALRLISLASTIKEAHKIAENALADATNQTQPTHNPAHPPADNETNTTSKAHPASCAR